MLRVRLAFRNRLYRWFSTTVHLSKETQQKVQQAIEQLGYVYNRFAANLRSQKSLTIGVVIDDLINPFFAEFTMGLEMTLAEHGFITVMSNTSQRSDRKNRCLIPCWNTTSRALSSVQ